MLDMVQQRLLSFGYEVKEDDSFALNFCIDKVQNIIKNDCNVKEIPEGLMQIAVDMVCGELVFMDILFVKCVFF